MAFFPHKHTKELETGCILGRLPFSCKVSTHEQTMFFMSMGNLQSAARLDCQPLNCENGANKVCSDLLPELLYCKITFWSTYSALFGKFDTTKMHPFIHQNTTGRALCNHMAAAACYRVTAQLAKRKDETRLNVLQPGFSLLPAALHQILKKKSSKVN